MRAGPSELDRDLELRSEVRKIALEWPAYGSRRITAELRAARWRVNRKRVQRRMREDNLLCMRKRKFAITTDSDHNLRVYPNLARRLALNGINPLWRADITYIRLEAEFVYLAVILDAFSRRVTGWALDRSLEDSLTLEALRMALGKRIVTPDLVHHVRISLSRQANPWDNAACESFMKTLKSEEVYRTEYRDLLQARSRIGELLEAVYNQKRLHSALDYRPPVEFESSLQVKKDAASRRLTA